MPHLRNRFASPLLLKLAKLWPVVGLIGPRQAGKTTLMQTLLQTTETLSFDDLELREEASKSPKTFLARLPSPLILDEVQKAPEIFDAIKLRVDRKRIPGSYFLTGSSTFSSKLDIKESLTGRIGIVELLPLTLAEMHQHPFLTFKTFSSALDLQKPRFSTEVIAGHVMKGGMPIPAFLRDTEQMEFYWRYWLETTISRDLARFFKRGYDPDLALRLLKRIGELLKEGELPTLKHFSQPTRKVRQYLDAMQEIFLVKKIHCHPEGIGNDVWILMDSGLANYLIGKQLGEGGMLSLVRHFLWNEWISQFEYQGRHLEKTYYKSAQGSPVDSIIEGIPYKIVTSPLSLTRRLKIEERALLGAMKKIGSKVGYLVGPVDHPIPAPKKGGIGILPWGTWS